MPELPKPKILAVEDDRHMQETYELLARDDGRVELLQAFSLAEAMELIEAHPGFAAVIMDGWVPRGRGETDGRDPKRIPPTVGLTSHLRRHLGFTGPIVVTSGDPRIQTELMAAGGTESCEKAWAMDRALTLIGLDGLKHDGGSH